jgi:hypothetical protein
MFEDLLVWFPMLWWGSIPSVGTVILRVAAPQDREIADDITVSTTKDSNRCKMPFFKLESSKTRTFHGES